MNLRFKGNVNDEAIAVNKAIFRMKDGGTIAIDRKLTPYHLKDREDGTYDYEMEWVDIYPWNINEYNLFSGEYVDDYVEQELIKLLSNSVLIALELEDETDSDYIITVSECTLENEDGVISIPVQLTRPEPKILTIKDFKAGDVVAIVSKYNGNFTIQQTTVKAVGRKYVTTDDAWSMKFMDVDDEYLLAQNDYGNRDKLFASLKEAEEYIEFIELQHWLNGINCINKGYSLQQLRAVKEILEGR